MTLFAHWFDRTPERQNMLTERRRKRRRWIDCNWSFPIRKKLQLRHHMTPLSSLTPWGFGNHPRGETPRHSEVLHIYLSPSDLSSIKFIGQQKSGVLPTETMTGYVSTTSPTIVFRDTLFPNTRDSGTDLDRRRVKIPSWRTMELTSFLLPSRHVCCCGVTTDRPK